MCINEIIVNTPAGAEVRKLVELTEESYNGKVPAIKKGTQVVFKNGVLGVYYVGKVFVDAADEENPFCYEMIMLSGGHAPTAKEKNLQPV